ncbi:MAG: DUF3080 family protein [Pseudomonadota bacterium]
MTRLLPLHTLTFPATLLMVAGLSLVPAGCSQRNDPAENFADYNARLSRALETALPPAAATRVPTWPAARDLVQEPPGLPAGEFAFRDFGRCGLLQEISERNGGPGRTQAPPQRLLYELRLLRGLRQCAHLTAGDLAGDDTARRVFAGTVRDVLAQQERELPQVYWNATFAAPEFREFFSVSALPLRPGDGDAAGLAAAALTALAGVGRLGPETPLPASDALEQHYYRLVGNKLGGRTWLSLDLASRELDRASSALEETRPERLCPGGKPGQQALRLKSVYDGVYVQRLQPWLGETGRTADQLALALERLWQAQQTTPPPVLVQYRLNVWAGVPGALVHDYDASVRRHARAWQRLLEPCGYVAAATPAP